MTSQEVRKRYLDFFRSKGHHIVSAAPIVVKGDPTLMFTNAGMNQFKELFLGNQPIRFPRIADTQHCLRVSGKHNDLEDVGHDTYHHTMFEMLGNWSFGDYFKEDAINWAWELLTQEYKINPQDLYATVFGGDSSENLSSDEEARTFWLKHLPSEHILDGSKKDNFWEMGDSGPCGPCSELHVDLRSTEEKALVPGRDLVNKDHPQVVEIWNLVFIQFNRLANGSLESLPAKHVDTGMGFERLCMALQNKKATYDTDVFSPIISEIEAISGVKYGADEDTDIAFRVISDHIRAITFIIADGQLPSNNKAGYVCRRILRRAIRYGYTFLGIEEPFLHRLVAVLNTQMGEVFVQLPPQTDFITQIIKEEELAFLRTLQNGLKLFEGVKENLRNSEKTLIPGKVVFELFDTYGFPVDLTALLAKENNLQIDEEEFELEMLKQKERSRADAKMDVADWVVVDSTFNTSLFVGYDELECEARIVRYREVNTKGKKIIQVVLNRTPFYAESGGQVGDTGYLSSSNETISVLKSYRENNLPVVEIEKLPLDINGKYKAVVNKAKRDLITKNHSGTHLLHAALREVLGKHVEQKGSLVNEEYLRFDFSHFTKLSEEQIERIEALVNEKIKASIPLDERRDVPIQIAKDLGAMALFGEKYGETVRVITFDSKFSVELCGGTHVKNSKEIGILKITSESSIATGVRRIEAFTDVKALNYLESHSKTFLEISEMLRNPKNVIHAISKLGDENQILRKQLDATEDLAAKLQAELLENQLVRKNGLDILIKRIDSPSVEVMKKVAQNLRRISSSVIVLSMEHEEKAHLVVAIGDEALGKLVVNASQLVKELAKLIQGGGGGQNTFATAGGSAISQIPEALQEAHKLLNLK